MIGVPGISQRLFGALAEHRININFITQASSEHSITFAVDDQQAEQAKRVVDEAFESVAEKLHAPTYFRHLYFDPVSNKTLHIQPGYPNATRDLPIVVKPQNQYVKPLSKFSTIANLAQ